MIKISPAILTYTKEDLDNQLKSYFELLGIGSQIDIDIVVNGKLFNAENTVDLRMVSEAIEQIKIIHTTIGLHIMADKPFDITPQYKSYILANKTRYYVHQDADINDRFDHEVYDNDPYGIVLNPRTELRNIEFYENFADVQIMTVEPGKQGGNFIEESLKKSLLLKEKGYEGIISVDGGVNLNTAAIIRKYPIDRVSVGSYFSKSKDVKQALADLDLALNGKIE
jgi:ribulose-phosphate 3-epimerase